MSEWFEHLDGLRDGGWDLLDRGASDPDSALHLAGLASIGLGGAAEARTVVLRGADRAAATLETHADRASHKVNELRANPLATFVFWDPGHSLQIRARVRMEVLTGAEAGDLWDNLSEGARRAYGGAPPPSTPMVSATDYTETTARDRMAILRGHVTAMDLLHLGALHRRALYEDHDGFKGMWLAP